MTGRKTARLDGAPKCPCCHTVLDAVTAGSDPANASPAAGDFSICVYCLATLRFVQRGRRMTLVKATPDERAMLDREQPFVHRARAAVIQATRSLGLEFKR